MGISVPAVVLAAQSACGVDGSVDGDVTLLKSLALLDKDYGTIHGYAEVYYASHRWCQLYESLVVKVKNIRVQEVCAYIEKNRFEVSVNADGSMPSVGWCRARVGVTRVC